jgi:hypothetical protein
METLTLRVEHAFRQASEKEIMERSLNSYVKTCVDGVNVSILSIGSSCTQKNEILYGKLQAQSIAESVFQGLLSNLESKAHTINSPTTSTTTNDGEKTTFSFYLRVSFIEFFEETITDLLTNRNDRRRPLLIEQDKIYGKSIEGLSIKGPLTNFDHFSQLIQQARKNRKDAMNLHGASSDFSSAFLRIYVKQVFEEENGGDQMLLSTFDLIELPATERLMKTAGVVRLAEGPLLNKSLFALENVIKSLSLSSRTSISMDQKGQQQQEEQEQEGKHIDELLYAPYDESQLTSLLQNTLGGNSLTFCMLMIAPGDLQGTKATFYLGDMLDSIINYPVINNDMIQGLLWRHYAEVFYLRNRTPLQLPSHNTSNGSSTTSMNSKPLPSAVLGQSKQHGSVGNLMGQSLSNPASVPIGGGVGGGTGSGYSYPLTGQQQQQYGMMMMPPGSNGPGFVPGLGPGGMMMMMMPPGNGTLPNQLGSITATTDQEYQRRLHDLEGRLVKEALEKTKFKEEKEKISQQMSDYRIKYQQLFDSEVSLRKELLESEEEKLKLSQTLIDLQMEMTNLQENLTSNQNEMQAKLIRAEQLVIQMEQEEIKNKMEIQDLCTKISDFMQLKQQILTELTNCQTQKTQKEQLLTKELAKNQQLSLELLVLNNQKQQCMKETSLLHQEKNKFETKYLEISKQMEVFNTTFEKNSLQQKAFCDEKEKFLQQQKWFEKEIFEKTMEISKLQLTIEKLQLQTDKSHLLQNQEKTTQWQELLEKYQLSQQHTQKLEKQVELLQKTNKQFEQQKNFLQEQFNEKTKLLNTLETNL